MDAVTVSPTWFTEKAKPTAALPRSVKPKLPAKEAMAALSWAATWTSRPVLRVLAAPIVAETLECIWLIENEPPRLLESPPAAAPMAMLVMREA